MKLEQQVTLLELSKRLKELSVKQESFFVWSVSSLTTMEPEVTTLLYASSIHGKGVDCSAFTVAELEQMLPLEVNFPFKNGKKRSHNHWRVIGKLRPNGYAARYVGGNSLTNIEVQAETFADSLAKMLIYLIENKLAAHP